MAQNEMKAKPALPERVRSMEGLGVGIEQLGHCVGVVCLARQKAPLLIDIDINNDSMGIALWISDDSLVPVCEAIVRKLD